MKCPECPITPAMKALPVWRKSLKQARQATKRMMELCLLSINKCATFVTKYFSHSRLTSFYKGGKKLLQWRKEADLSLTSEERRSSDPDQRRRR
jgi:hypothetical protein